MTELLLFIGGLFGTILAGLWIVVLYRMVRDRIKHPVLDWEGHVDEHAEEFKEKRHEQKNKRHGL